MILPLYCTKNSLTNRVGSDETKGCFVLHVHWLKNTRGLFFIYGEFLLVNEETSPLVAQLKGLFKSKHYMIEEKSLRIRTPGELSSRQRPLQRDRGGDRGWQNTPLSTIFLTSWKRRYLNLFFKKSPNLCLGTCLVEPQLATPLTITDEMLQFRHMFGAHARSLFTTRVEPQHVDLPCCITGYSTFRSSPKTSDVQICNHRDSYQVVYLFDVFLKQKLNTSFYIALIWWHTSAITCQIIKLTCQIFMLSCQIFMLTCQIFMLTCHLFVCQKMNLKNVFLPS